MQANLRPSAVRFLSVRAHELHTFHRDVLLLDGFLSTHIRAHLHRLTLDLLAFTQLCVMYLDTRVVFEEQLAARVCAAVSFQELLGEPAVKTLVVLALELRAALADAVHLHRPLRKRSRRL